ncbi:UDP-glycosyltransferase UGT4-like [Chironomus tepperi]|uniref:UDP-glycosyltransferase UGT4-like n=1 Tax=Chironomus tepperi TaxID=113505 RepID=UPI00391F9AE3
MKSKAVAIVLIISILSCEASRILFMNPTFSKSHTIPLQALAKILASRGHDVTFVSPFKLNENVQNYREIQLEVSAESLKNFDEFSKVMSESNPLGVLTVATKTIFNLGNETLQSTAIRHLMDTEQFDLIVVGWFTNSFLVGLADHFKCPSVVFFSGSLFSMLHQMVGNPLAAADAPHAMSGRKEHSTFYHRLTNFFFYAFDVLVIRNYFNYRSKVVYE